MTNPLAARRAEKGDVGGARPFGSVEDMREWCWDKNLKARDAGWNHWLYVSEDKDSETRTIKARTGSDAADVVAVIRGWYPDFKGWDAERLASEFRILRHMARMGMTEEKFASIRFAPIAA